MKAAPRPRAPRPSRWLPITASVDDVDRHRWVLAPAAAFVAGAVALRAFGLPPVDLHSPLHHLGVMDPLCGGTRGTLALSRGDVGGAWAFNPLVPALAAAAALVVIRWAAGSITGRWLNLRLRHRRAAFALAVLITAALWVNQQLNANLLSTDGPRFPGVGRVAG